MKPLAAQTNSGRTKARDEIHHRTADGGRSARPAVAKAQRKAARRVDWTQIEIAFLRA